MNIIEISQLMKDLTIYNRIFCTENKFALLLEELKYFSKYDKSHSDEKKPLISHTLKALSLQSDVCVRSVDLGQFMFIKKLYHTYQFSDRFQVISDETMYGTIFNYVDTGILTMEEAFDALLR